MDEYYRRKVLKMENENYKLLNDAIQKCLETINSLNQDSEEYKKAVNNLETLYKLRLEEMKLIIDKEDKKEKRSIEDKHKCSEIELKDKQLAKEIDNADLDRKSKSWQVNKQIIVEAAKIGVEVLGIMLPLAFYSNWMMEGFKFEETGSFTSTTFKGLFQKFKPTK